MPEVKARRITSIKEIAKLADCSIATVSNALNNKGRISDEVREKIIRLCRKHGYLPNSAGRNLRRGQNETIGLIFYPNCAAIFRNVYYAEIVEALEVRMEGYGYDLLLSGYETGLSGLEAPRFVRQGKVDGIIMLGRFPRVEVRRIKEFGIPVIQLDAHREHIDVDFVTTDGYGACGQIVDHLVSLGHRRIVFVAFAHEDTNADQREAGFREAVSRHSLEAATNVSIRDGDTTTACYGSLKKLLGSERPPTAVIAVNDTLAAELQDFLQADGYAVPGDISIFGFDDDAHSRKATPPISTVRVDKEQLGRLGAELVIKRIENPDRPRQSLNLPAELVHRESVARPPEG